MRKRQSGILLLDVLVALSILALALLLASYPLHSAQQAWNNAITRQYALQIAENTIERIRLNSGPSNQYGYAYAGDLLWNESDIPLCSSCSIDRQMHKDVQEMLRQWKAFSFQAEMRVRRCNQALCLYLWWGGYSFNGTKCEKMQCVQITFIP